MQTKPIRCTCGKELEYWTLHSSIQCPYCKTIIAVEPCEEIIEEEQTESEEVEI